MSDVKRTHLGPDLSPREKSLLLLAIFAVGFAILSLWMNVASGGFLEADGITHYLYARWAFESPFLLTDVWGRPVVTTLHALPAQLPGRLLGQPAGLIAVRVVSLLLALGCALVAWRVARVGREDHERPAMAGLFTLASPLVFLHSFSELTELPFAFLSICCLWAYARKQWVVLALIAGLLPATRPEGIGFVLMVFGGLVLHRRWLAAPLVLIGPIVWAYAGWVLTGRPWAPDDSIFRPMFDVLPAWLAGPIAWLPNSWPYSGESLYDSGPLLKFVGMLPAVVGPGLMPFLLVGVARSFRGGRELLADHTTRVRWIAAFIPLFVLTVHSLLHWTGKLASSGDVRYLVAVAPFWGLLVARGFDGAANWFRWEHPLRWATLLAVVPLLGLQLYYPIVPIGMDADSQTAIAVVEWYEESELAKTHPNVRANHPVFWYAIDGNPMGAVTHAVVKARKPGTVLLWHEIYSLYNADARYSVPVEMPIEHGWTDATPAGFPEAWRVFVSE